MSRKSTSSTPFDTVTLEGSLFLPDTLAKIALGEHKDTQGSGSYGIPDGLTLQEEIGRAFRIAQALGRNHRFDTPDAATRTSAETFVLKLLREALGYDIPAAQPSRHLDGRTFRIHHFANGCIPLVIAAPGHDLDSGHADYAIVIDETSAARKRSPFQLAQEFLNASAEHTWAIVTNGLRIRLLRDAPTLTRPAFLEFDLQAILSESRYPDFAALWRILHGSRAQTGDGGTWETWRNLGIEEGARVRDGLRDGVTLAIRTLGSGFLAHPANQPLRDALDSGTLRTNTYYNQLLRLIYRMIFLITVEERGLLHGTVANSEWRVANRCEANGGEEVNGEWRMANGKPATTPPLATPLAAPSGAATPPFTGATGAATPPFATHHSPFAGAAGALAYASGYSMARLRDRALRRRMADRHHDLWVSLRIVFKGLAKGAPELALPALGGLFDPEQCPDIDSCELSNDALIDAIHNLRIWKHNGTTLRIDFKNMGPEELGSVYESLLELVPQVNLLARRFEFAGLDDSASTAGNKRKTTGSYYTPDCLVQQLIKTALDPVIEDRLREAERMANGEWRTANGLPEAWRSSVIVHAQAHDNDFGLQATGNLAAGTRNSQGGLSGHAGLPQGGTLRHDLANTPGSDLDSGEHRGRMGTPLSGGVHPVSPHGKRQQDRTGDASDSLGGCRPLLTRGNHSVAGGDGDPRSSDTGLGTEPEKTAGSRCVANGGAGANGEWRIANGKPDTGAPATPPSPLTAPSGAATPPFATHHSPFAGAAGAPTPPFATHHSPFASATGAASAAILSIKVCDPACGSGHFLLGAARRIAEQLAAVRATDGGVKPADYRHALREVIAHCIYGVDLNPMAVELARMALWLEGYAEGMPLTFLDHHIKCGNAILGITDWRQLEHGIPDDAYAVLSGDDKTVCKELKARNKQEIKKRRERVEEATLAYEPADAQSVQQLDAMPDDTVEAIARKREHFKALATQLRQRHQAQAADLFIGTFLLPKDNPRRTIPSTRHLDTELHPQYRAMANSSDLAETQSAIDAVRPACAKARVFHWPLEFPDIIAAGGFDCILANPPWERIKLQEEEFFAARHADIANAKNKAERTKRIEWLRDGMLHRHLYPTHATPNAPLEDSEKELHAEFISSRREAEALSTFVHVAGPDGGRFPLSGIGDVNLYALFAETITQVTHPGGRAGFITPSGIATDDSTKQLFAHIGATGHLCALYDFENRNGLFPAVDSRMKFTLLTYGKSPAADFACFLTHPDQLDDTRRRFTLSPEDFARINPNTRTCPVFRSQKDAELTKAIYRRVPVLIREADPESGQGEDNPWGISFMRLLDMSNDSGCFIDAGTVPDPESRPDLLPLYEAKMIHHFDHRWATYAPGHEGKEETDDVTDAQKQDPRFKIRPRYYVPKSEVDTRLAAKNWTRPWLMGWRDICRATDERTVIATVIPKAGVGHTMPLFQTPFETFKVALLLANLTTFCVDYIARQKVGGTHLTYNYLKQFPVLPPTAYTQADLEFIVPRVLALTYTSHDLSGWAQDIWDSANAPLRAAILAQFPTQASTPHSPLFRRPREGHPVSVSPPSVGAAPLRCATPSPHHGCSVATTGSTPHSPFAIHHSPPSPFAAPQRSILRAELDAYYARLYGLTRDDLRYILDPTDIMGPDYPSETFRVLKNKDLKEYGEYRTQRLTLEAWDRMGG